jgi:hypothetical protein
MAPAFLGNGEAARSPINHVSQVAIITGFIASAGYGKRDIEKIDRVEQVIFDVDSNGTWHVPDSLIDHLTIGANGYDRQAGWAPAVIDRAK